MGKVYLGKERNEIMEQSEQQIMKRFKELAEQSNRNCQYLFTNFLSLAEQDLLYRATKEYMSDNINTSGGMEGAERIMARFGSPKEFGYEMDYPIVCLRVSPVMKKFAEDLTHRDYLGALMHLGIKRELLGDIVIHDKTAYLFCEEHISDYIVENLTKIRHTSVSSEKTTELPAEVSPHLEEQEFIVSAERADAIVAKIYHLSRSQSLDLFRSQKIFVGGRLFENNSGCFPAGSIVSVRGYGRFRYDGALQETKKGRLKIKAALYGNSHL